MAIRPVCGIPEPVSKNVMKLTPRLGVRARRDATLTEPAGEPTSRQSRNGALGGLLGGLVRRYLGGRYLQGKPLASGALIAAAVVLGTQLGQAVLLPRLQERTLANAYKRIADDTELQEQTLLAHAYKGVADEFGERVGRIFIEEVGDVLVSPQCRTVTDKSLSAGLSKLSSEDVREYFRLTARGLQAVVTDSPAARRVSPSQVRPVVRSIVESLARPERERFERTSAPSVHLSPEEQCAALHTLTGGAAALSDEGRATLLLAMNCAANEQSAEGDGPPDP